MQASTAATAAIAAPRKPIYTHLYFQVLTAIVIGVCSAISIRKWPSR